MSLLSIRSSFIDISGQSIPSPVDTSGAPSSNITLSDSAQEASEPSSSPKLQSSLFQSCKGPEEQSAEVLTPQNRNATEDGSLQFHTPTSTSDVATSSVTGPPCPESSRGSLMDSTISTAEDTLMDLRRLEFSLKSQLGENHDAPEEKVPPVTASHPSATDTMPASFFVPFQRSGESSALSHSCSMPSLSETPSTRNRKCTRRKQSQCLSDVTLQDSFEGFTPEISDGGNSEIYWFQCTSPGLYQCSETDLVFNMEGEGDVTYRKVHWDWRLLAQHHKKPAGPLFDIRCQQQSVCQLHLRHFEIRSTGACQFLSVAHVTDEGTDFILPHEITETHVVINITGFSGYGNVKDEVSPLNLINIQLSLTDSNSSLCVWEGRVDLSSAAIRKPQSQSVVVLRPDNRLFSIRKAFIDRVSQPMLQSLLDWLLEKRVINDSENEEAHGMQNRADKARFVIDMVRKKGERASSEMITFLCQEDKCLSETLGLM
ncbi:uncharacterized protein LOC115379196 [Myripristis murdjan]|uniref:uncharacterized protein LOC115379196 n=1 Tax=Myripristis murdjan TaxID=586833 RepID=UPI0011761218|nr:uncharacterized protein LOC115379196 [Myripristis murdjan]